MPLITGSVVDRSQTLSFTYTQRATVKTAKDSLTTNISNTLDPFVTAVATTFEATVNHARLRDAATRVQGATLDAQNALLLLDVALRDLGLAVLADGAV